MVARDSRFTRARAEERSACSRRATAADASTCGSATSYCDAYVAYADACGLQKYTCEGGCGFLAKCNAFDGAINSVQRRAAETACLTAANCDTSARRDCEYRKYAEQPQTAAQQALVSQYCMTCAAGDASCATPSVPAGCRCPSLRAGVRETCRRIAWRARRLRGASRVRSPRRNWLLDDPRGRAYLAAWPGLIVTRTSRCALR